MTKSLAFARLFWLLKGYYSLDNQKFKRIAKALLKSSEYKYIISVGKKGKLSTFSISINPDEITHITGLDHLPSVNDITGHKNHLKRQIIMEISSGERSYSDFKQNDIDILNSPIAKTYNPQTRTCFTLMNRIEKLKNINVFLSMAYKGKIYDWKKPLFPIKTPDGQKRALNISADYLIAIPSNIPNEKIYLFMYVDKYSKESITKLNIFSAFQDGVDLSQSQSELGTILKEERINNKTHTSRIIIDKTNPNISTAAPQNVMQMSFNSLNSNLNLLSPNGDAVAEYPRHPFIDGICSLLDRLGKWFEDRSTKNRNRISKLEKQLEKRENQLADYLDKNSEQKQLISDITKLLEEKDKQIANLKENCTELSNQLEKQKQLVPTAAKSKGSFLDNLDGFANRVHAENAVKAKRQGDPKIKPKNTDPKL